MEYINQEIISLRLHCAVLESELKKCADGGQVFDGSSCKENSLKEFVYYLAKYLKVSPKIDWTEEPDVTVTKRVRHYQIIKKLK